jgi:hypothetical protein
MIVISQCGQAFELSYPLALITVLKQLCAAPKKLYLSLINYKYILYSAF